MKVAEGYTARAFLHLGEPLIDGIEAFRDNREHSGESFCIAWAITTTVCIFMAWSTANLIPINQIVLCWQSTMNIPTKIYTQWVSLHRKITMPRRFIEKRLAMDASRC